MSRVIADGPEPRFGLDRVEAAIHGSAGIGGGLDHAMKGRGPPPRGAGTGPAFCLLEPAADFAQAQAVEPNPGKDQANKACLLGHDLEPRNPTPSLAGNVAIPVRCACEGAD